MKNRQSIMLTVTLALFLFAAGQAYGAVSLYLVDDPNIPGPDGDDLVSVQATLMDLNPGDAITANLQYSWDNSSFVNWTHLVGETVLTFKQIFFRLELFSNGNSTGYDEDGTIFWNGDPEGVFYGMPAYSGALIDWGNFQIGFLSSNSNDNFGPGPIPIQPSILLLGTGLLALLGSRRRFFRK